MGRLKLREYMFNGSQWFSRSKGDLENKHVHELENPPDEDSIIYWCMGNPGKWTRDLFP